MSLFDEYRPLPEDRNPVHLCWRTDGRRSWYRNDGLVVTRSNAFAGWEIQVPGEEDVRKLNMNIVGSMEDDDALGYIDRGSPCRIPPPMSGQVWAARGESTYAELMVMGALRAEGGFLVPIFVNGVKMDKDWPPPGMTLIEGPGAPWQPPVKLPPAPKPEGSQ